MEKIMTVKCQQSQNIACTTNVVRSIIAASISELLLRLICANPV